jgi:hypothetical protein
MLQTRTRNLFYLLLVFLASAVLYAIFFYTQKPISYTFSYLFDGNQYLKSYLYFSGAVESYRVSFPFHSRVMMPLLVSFLHYDVISGFNIVNSVFILGGILAIFQCWRNLGFPVYLVIAGLAWLTLHWVGIIRYNLYDPVSVDTPLYLFGIIFLVAVIRNKPWLMLLSSVIPVFNKESIIPILAVLLLFYMIQWMRREEHFKIMLFYAVALFSVILIKMLLDHYFPPLQSGRGSIRTLLFHSRETLQHPFRIIHWLTGCIVAFGPWLALFLMTKTQKKIAVDKPEFLLLLMAIAWLVISFLGGNDFTRLIFLGFPFIMTWFLYSLKDLPPRIIFFSLFLGLPFTRFFEMIPDPGRLGWQPFNAWHPEFASPAICLGWTSYFVIMGVVIFVIKRREENKQIENRID